MQGPGSPLFQEAGIPDVTCHLYLSSGSVRQDKPGDDAKALIRVRVPNPWQTQTVVGPAVVGEVLQVDIYHGSDRL